MAAVWCLVFGFVLASVSLNEARFLRTGQGSYRGPQRGPSRDPPRQIPLAAGDSGWRFPGSLVDPVKKLPVQQQQQQQQQPGGTPNVGVFPKAQTPMTPMTPLTPRSWAWSFPGPPADPVKKFPVQRQQQQQQTVAPAAPTTGDRVAVRCGESRIRVEVNQDLMGLGRLIRPEDLTLGACPPTAVDDRAHVLVFDYELHSCGSRLVMTNSGFVYAFVLIYEPKASGMSPITRSQSAVIGVECHY